MEYNISKKKRVFTSFVKCPRGERNQETPINLQSRNLITGVEPAFKGDGKV